MVSTVADIGDAAQSENNDNDADDYDFYPNETADGYCLFGDVKAYAAAVLDVCGLDKPSISTYNLTRDDIPRLVSQAKNEGWHPMQAKWAVDAAMKSWLGDRQANENEGFGIGFAKEDGVVTGFHEGGYAAAFGALLPTLDVEDATTEEMNALDDAGANVDDLGFRPDSRPVFPVFTEGRYPGAVTSWDELDAAVALLDEFPAEPSLGNTSNGDEKTVDDVDAPFDPADYTVAELRTEIEEGWGLDALLDVRDVERDGKERKTAIEALDAAIEAAKERLDSVASDDEGTRYDVATDGGSSTDDKVRAFNALVDQGVPANEAASRVGL